MNTKKYQTGGKKKVEKDAQVDEVIPKDAVWEDGKIVKIVKTGAKTQRVVIGVYYVSDGTDGHKKGTKVKGLKPVVGTVPRRRRPKKSGGVMEYKYGGPKMYQQAGAHNYSSPLLSGYAGPSYGHGNVGLNFNPKINMGYASNQGENASELAKLGNLQIGANLGLNSNKNTGGLTAGYTQPLAVEGLGQNLIASGNAHIGAPLKNKGEGAFGDFSAGLGYYNNSGNTYGIKGTLGANIGATGHRAGQGAYGEIQGNYGPLSIYGGRGGQGNYGGIGLNIPLNAHKKQTEKQTGGTRLVRKEKEFMGEENYNNMLEQQAYLKQNKFHSLDPRTFNTNIRTVFPYPSHDPLNTAIEKASTSSNQKQTGGMYGPNTMAAAGQGMSPQLGTSSTIVGQETDPALQQARMQGLAQSGQGLSEESQALSQQTRQQEIIDKQRSEQEAMLAEQQYQQQNAAIGSAVNRAGQFIGNRVSDGKAPGPGSWGEAFNVGKQGYNLTKAANIANDASKMSEAAQLATDAGGWIGSSADAAQTGTMVLDASGNVVNAGSAVGNAANSAMSAMPWGTIANYAGQGISKWADDDDPTRSNAGEYAGKIVSRAGQGASLGSFFPGPGTAIGAGIGAIVGGVEQAVGTNKARKAEQEYEAEARTARNEGIYDLNKRVGNLYGSHMSNVAAGNLAQKTISGQNLGRNVMYQKGGNKLSDRYETYNTMDVPFSIAGQRFPAIPSEAHSQMMQNRVTSADITPYGLKPNHPLAMQQQEGQTMNKMNQIRNFQKSQLTYRKGGVKQGMMMAMPRYGYNF
tara:strand:+ start:7334 stop:9727 length:2394 start_codon:yes stop_codon:yes gene_type:complete